MEVDRREARKAKWKAGFYRVRSAPSEAFDLLIKHALGRTLGRENVVRVERQRAIDSWGREALKITVVIAPDAVPRLAENALDALVSLQKRLREMREDRTPIIEYATEAELAQNAGP